MADHTPYQKKIIRRYYDKLDDIAFTRLQELTSEIYLAEGKKVEKLWKQVEGNLAKLKLSQQRIDHLLGQRDPKLLAELVKEMADRLS